jgi:hypothetical protein
MFFLWNRKNVIFVPVRTNVMAEIIFHHTTSIIKYDELLYNKLSKETNIMWNKNTLAVHDS